MRNCSVEQHQRRKGKKCLGLLIKNHTDVREGSCLLSTSIPPSEAPAKNSEVIPTAVVIGQNGD